MLVDIRFDILPHHLFFALNGSLLAYFVTCTLIIRSDLWKTINRRKKYATSNLNDEQKKVLLTRIQEYVHRTEPFLNPKYSVVDLSSETGIPRNQISQVLNEMLHTKFYDYLNRFRIEKVKKLMVDADYSHYSLFGLAMEAGFNNKTTFISSFKKIEGVTPSAYKEIRLAKLDSKTKEKPHQTG